MGVAGNFGGHAMSRSTRMSAAAVKSALEREATLDFVQLLEITFTGEEAQYFCNQAVEHKLDEEGFEEEDDYGVPVMGLYHKGQFYYFLPFGDGDGQPYRNTHVGSRCRAGTH